MYEQSVAPLQVGGEQELLRRIEGLTMENQRLQRAISQFEATEVPRPYQQPQGEGLGGLKGEYRKRWQYRKPTEGTRQGENSPGRGIEEYRYEGEEGPEITPKGPQVKEEGKPPERGTNPSRPQDHNPIRMPDSEAQGVPYLIDITEFTGNDPSVDIGRWLDNFEQRLACYDLSKQST